MLLNKEGQEIINSKAIMSELKDFYEDLYDNKDTDTGVDELHNCSGCADLTVDDQD